MNKTSSMDVMMCISKMYYHGGMSQEEIAKFTGMSRPKISRILTMAKQRGIVEFQIDANSSQRNRMANELKSVFDLKDVIIVPSSPIPKTAIKNLAHYGGAYIDCLLKDNVKIGVLCNEDLLNFVEEYSPTSPVYNCTVCQINLSAECSKTANATANALCSKLKATSEIIECFDSDRTAIAKKLHYLDVILVDLTEDNSALLSKCSTAAYASEFISTKSASTVIGIAAKMRSSDSVFTALSLKYIDVLILDDLAALGILYNPDNLQ